MPRPLLIGLAIASILVCATSLAAAAAPKGPVATASAPSKADAPWLDGFGIVDVQIVIESLACAPAGGTASGSAPGLKVSDTQCAILLLWQGFSGPVGVTQGYEYDVVVIRSSGGVIVSHTAATLSITSDDVITFDVLYQWAPDAEGLGGPEEDLA